MKKLIHELREDRRLRITLLAILVGAVIAAGLMVAISASAINRRYNTNLQYGYASMEAQAYPEAVVAFEKAYAIDPTDEAALGLAQAWFANGNTEKALQVVTSRMELYEETPELNALLEEYKEAIGYYKTVEIAGETINRADTAVFFENVTLTEEDKAAFSKFKNLVTVSLVNCGLTDIEFLRDCDKLMSVTLVDNPISDLSPLEGKPDLRTLHIDNTAVTDFSQICKLKGLTTLSATGMWLTVTARDAMYEALPFCTIYTSYDHLIFTYTLGTVTFNTDAEEIDLSNQSITDISLLNKCIQLKKLNLSNIGLGWLNNMDPLSSLTWLDLSGNKINGIHVLDDFVNLTYLNLNGNNVTDLRPTAKMTELTELYLDGNPIYHGHSTLSKLTKLQKLNLSDTLLADKHLEYIPMAEMTELDLRNNPNLTAEAVADFVSKYPNCTIFHDYQ